jgi:hypothetical protein
MYDQEGRRLKSVCWIEFTFVGLTNGRRASHPQELMSFLKSVEVNEAYEPDGFNQRVEALRTASKLRG